MDENYTGQDMARARFRNVSLAEATFDDVNLGKATFQNVNLSGAKFTDINFSHAVIEESCIEGLVIWGYDIQALIEAEKKRQAGQVP